MKLTEEQITQCREIFNRYNNESTGKIDRFDLRVVLEGEVYVEMGYKASEEEIFAIMNELEADNTGEIEFYQFLSVYERRMDARQADADDQDLSTC